MLSSSEREAIVALIKREVVPAIGCTEPVAVSLCVARATELIAHCRAKLRKAEEDVNDIIANG